MSPAFWKTMISLVWVMLVVAAFEYLTGHRGDVASGIACLALFRTYAAELERKEAAPSTPEARNG